MAGESRKVYVVGVGMTKFLKPDSHARDYPELVTEAVSKALEDSSMGYESVEQACVGYVYGDSTCGQRALYEVGMSGIPIYNINNNCATGATALYVATQLVQGGIADCVLAVGFEKMPKETYTTLFPDRVHPMNKHMEKVSEVLGREQIAMDAQIFGSAGKEHMEKYGTKSEHFAKIAHKNHKNSTKNPYSLLQHEYSMMEIMNSVTIYSPLTELQCYIESDGAAAVILVSEKFMEKHNLKNRAVEILGIEMATDFPSTFEDRSMIKLMGFDMTTHAASKLYEKTGVNPSDIDVIELHDNFSTNELISYEALGLCDVGKGGEMVNSGNNTYGGRHVVNPSGGLLSRGHPFGATGIAQCVELCWHLRNEAGDRQVKGAKLALQHNMGLGGAVIVALYKLAFPNESAEEKSQNKLRFQLPQEMNRLKSARFFYALQNLIIDAIESSVKPNEKISVKFIIKDDDSDYVAVGVGSLQNGKIYINFDPKAKTDITITIKDSIICDILTKKYSPESAFFSGKFKIQGNVALLLKYLHLKDLLLSKL